MNNLILLAGGFDIFSSYGMIISASVIVILSYFFNIIAKKTNIPSVLLLILTGILIKLGMDAMHIEEIDFFPILEVLGIVGLIMIVLEAALDLELRKDKLPIIWRAMVVAFIGVLVCAFGIAFLIQFFIEVDYFRALIYATPLAIMSSAIIIPSVGNLEEEKKEFMIYESTLSDILGIMFFYFLIGIHESGSIGAASFAFTSNLVLTILESLVVSYILVLIFQNITAHVKLFLLIAILLLLYSVGKLMHLSPLLIILIFGIVLTNDEIFFRGPLEKLIKRDKVKAIEEDFYIVTIETAFLIRTFFFVIFGITISLSSLLSIEVLIISLLIILLIYVSRYLSLLLVSGGKSVFPQLFIAPRGLITILLFFAIPKALEIDEFNSGILLFIILVSSLVMTFGLIFDARSGDKLAAAIGDAPIRIDELGNDSPIGETNVQDGSDSHISETNVQDGSDSHISETNVQDGSDSDIGETNVQDESDSPIGETNVQDVNDSSIGETDVQDGSDSDIGETNVQDGSDSPVGEKDSGFFGGFDGDGGVSDGNGNVDVDKH